MTSNTGTTIAKIKGKEWNWKYDRLCNVLKVNLQSFVWHLWDACDYHGNFPTKSKMMDYIEAGE